MKNLIVYESIHHSNTEKIGKTMAECLNAELIKSDDVNVNNLMDYDLIGFGPGIYYSKFHKNILDLIDKLPNFPNKKAFVFAHVKGGNLTGGIIDGTVNAIHLLASFEPGKGGAIQLK